MKHSFKLALVSFVLVSDAALAQTDYHWSGAKTCPQRMLPGKVIEKTEIHDGVTQVWIHLYCVDAGERGAMDYDRAAKVCASQQETVRFFDEPTPVPHALTICRDPEPLMDVASRQLAFAAGPYWFNGALAGDSRPLHLGLARLDSCRAVPYTPDGDPAVTWADCPELQVLGSYAHPEAAPRIAQVRCCL